MKKSILFRADANPSIGTGDLISLIHLSRYFENAGWQTYFMARGYDAAGEILKRHGIKNSCFIGRDIPVSEEVAAMNDLIGSRDIDVVFFEITERPLADYKGITEKVIKACVDFSGAVPDDMSMVINWDVNAERLYDRGRYRATTFLLGPEYVVLPVEFDFNKIRARRYKSRPENILVSMGGADELNFTQKVVDALAASGTALKVNVVIGGGYQSRRKLEDSLRNSGINYEVKQNIAGMFDEFMNCDVAIAAGGLTCFELVATRTPSVIIALYEHQIDRCVYFDKMGWVNYLGFRSFDEDLLLRKVLNPVTNLPENIFKTGEVTDRIDGLLQRH